jgi:zinc D-Ala-D-Ala dipeptidase
MGSPIDELSPRSAPDYFAQQIQAGELNFEALALAKTADCNRQLLAQAMIQAGFQRHLGEWWHFCLGDQMWVWLSYPPETQPIPAARYGRYDLIGS